MDALSDIARAVLYEGYILWPYRRSALKNRQRWTFGGVYPPLYSAASGGVDRARVRAQCLVEAAAGAHVDVEVRFLQVVSRHTLRAEDDGFQPVDEIVIDGSRLLSWDEAMEREVTVSLSLNSPSLPVDAPIDVEADRSREELRDSQGSLVGAIERHWEQLVGVVTASTEPVGVGLHRLTIEIANTSSWDSADRESAMRRTFASAHAALRVTRGAFVSLLDPPTPLVDAASGCRGDGLWPVLVGSEGSHDAMLASPLILYDYPRVAPESPGDFFDGGEIDQLLILNILTMSDEEKDEMRATDPKAREILERSEALSSADVQALHGTIRSLREISR
jgi:hypothetical protein